MILGVGLDVVDVEAFAVQLADPASAFVEATFRPGERSGGVDDRSRRARHLAGQFAAKEALVKAWSGARRGRPPALAEVDLRDVEVVDDGFGRPGLRLHGPVRAGLADLAPAPGAGVSIHVAITHDGPTAVAVVILEA